MNSPHCLVYLRYARSLINYLCERTQLSVNERHLSEVIEWVLTANDARRLQKHLVVEVHCSEANSVSIIKRLVALGWVERRPTSTHGKRPGYWPSKKMLRFITIWETLPAQVAA